MDSASLSSVALHEARGISATPRRIRQFARAAGLSENTSLDAPQLASMLVPVPGITTVSELARTVCRDCGLSQNLLDQVQTLYNEIDQPYPTAFDPLIKQLIDQFNKIDERSEIHALQREALRVSRSSAEGLDLAQRIATAVERTRAKDLVGCRIAMLTTLFDQSVAAAQRRHREISGASSAAFRSAVCKTHAADRNNEPSFTTAEIAEVAAALGMQPDSVNLHPALKLHIEEAIATMHVEQEMQ